jgi:hypothetical protein
MSSRLVSNQSVQRTGGQRRFAARWFSQRLMVCTPAADAWALCVDLIYKKGTTP